MEQAHSPHVEQFSTTTNALYLKNADENATSSLPKDRAER